MALTNWVRCSIAIGFLVAFARPIDLESCGPFIPSAVFVRAAAPDDQTAFFKGQLGVLKPTYWHRYLAMSYRIMSGLPIADAQAVALNNEGQTRMMPPELMDSDAVKRWEAARKTLLLPPTDPIKPYRMVASYQFYVNCNDNAFDTATATLQARIQAAGAKSKEVRDWVSAQDTVFWNCGNQEARIPDTAPSGSSARVNADRAYQIAAANLYAGNYGQAKSMFQQIAADAKSEWHVIAPYLAARVDLRNGDYKTAQSELQAIVKDSKLGPIQAQAKALLQYTAAKADPAARLIACSKLLMAKDSSEVPHDLTDFTFLYDKLDEKAVAAAAKADDLIAWIETMQGRVVGDSAVDRWQRDHTLPWLIAALVNASDQGSHSAEIMDAGLQVPVNSSAWATARFHAIRLLIAAGRVADARKALDDAAPQINALSQSGQNDFLDEKMETAEKLSSFLASAAHMPVGQFSYEDVEPVEGKGKGQRLLAEDAARDFNLELPLKTWLESAKTIQVPVDIRRQLAQIGFTRAFLLKDALAIDFARIVAQLSHDDAASMNRYIAASGDDRFNEGIFWLLHRPGMGVEVRAGLPRSEADQTIDDFRDNWWAKRQEPRVPETLPIISFAGPDEKKRGADEARRVRDLSSGRLVLASSVVTWAKSHPDDPRLAEALALTVRVSHYSESDPAADHFVEQAFNLLHQRFPGSTWAKQTPYWFKE